MASAPRSTTDQLTPLQRLAVEPHRFSLFAALRLLEQAHVDSPRLGESRRAAADVVRLGQSPYLTFAPSEVSSCDSPEGDRVRLEQYVFGVFGPNGALPLHLTEHAYERSRHYEDSTFADFVNLFQHRLISLFYRAWANCDPATNFDRPDSDRFADWVGATFGLAGGSARNRDAVIDYAKLTRAGLYAQQARSADGLQAIFSGYFGLEVRVRQFVGAWLSTPREEYCRLGGGGEPARLGLSATLGESSWQCQHKFEIVLGPLAHVVFRDFLPGARALAELHALVRLYTNDEWTWQLRLLLRDAEIPGVAIGQGGQLGWTSWLGTPRTHADDVLIQERQAAGSQISPTGN